MKRLRLYNSVGQCIAEYVILFATISAALIGLTYYMKVAIQSVVKVAADEAGKQEDAIPTYKLGGAKTDSTGDRYYDNIQIKSAFGGGMQRVDIQNFEGNEVEGESITKEEK